MNRLQLNPGKTSNFGFWGHLDPGIYHLCFGMGLLFPRQTRWEIWGPLGCRIPAQRAGGRRPFAQVQVEYHLYPFLDQETLHLVTHALITLFMNYCNALLMGLPLKHIQRLKLMQNAVTKELHVHLDLHILHHKTLYVLPVSYPESQR